MARKVTQFYEGDEVRFYKKGSVVADYGTGLVMRTGFSGVEPYADVQFLNNQILPLYFKGLRLVKRNTNNSTKKSNIKIKTNLAVVKWLEHE